MYYPILRAIKYKSESIITTLGDGVNTYGTPLNTKPSEARNALNLSSRRLPALCVRQGRKGYASNISVCNAMGERNNEYLHIQDGTTWKYWNGSSWVTIQTGLASQKGKILDFVRGVDRSTILMNGTDRYAWNGSTVTSLTQAPATNKFTVHKGRVYALVGTTIKFSALNNIEDWTTVNDAGEITITNAKGDGSAITTYGGYVIAFTEHSMHILFGTGPTNYELVDVPGNIGCISNKSVVTCNNTLYFVSYDGVYAFKGGEPVKISHKVDEYFRNMNLGYKVSIASGAAENNLYVSIPSTSTSTGNDLVIKYNVTEDKWYPENGNITDFVTIGNKLYGIDNNGKIWDMANGLDDDGTAISWFWESAPRFVKPSVKQTLSSVWVTFDLPAGSTLSVYVSNSFDNDDWELVKTFTAENDEQNKKILVPITRTNDVFWYRVKFSGAGQCIIHSIEEKYRVRE